MLRRFSQDKRGQFAMMTAIAIVPILGGLAVAIDYAEMNRQQQETLNALDAAAIATARRVVDGATDAVLMTYAKDFFEANLSSVNPKNTKLNIVLPKNNTGGGTLKMSAALKYDPYFFPAFTSMVNNSDGGGAIAFDATSEVQLKNTLEVALVLDNSGSMDEKGKGSSQKRIDLLKSAAKELVAKLALQAGQMKQITKPVQFGVVPFAASVNVGPSNDTATWMDTLGISPIHHENFDWGTINTTNKFTELSGGVRYARGNDWGALKNQALTRFTLYKNITKLESETWVANWQNVCVSYRSDGVTCRSNGWEWQDKGQWNRVYSKPVSWQGCVESRPYPYNVNDAAASSGTPATMFVPMFAPDEAGDTWTVSGQTKDNYSAYNNWWNDGTETSSAATRQKNMTKYFDIMPINGNASTAQEGVNSSCTTTAITPLQDVTNPTGLGVVNTAIDAMGPNGATNVPEGMAWGWRVVSGGAPFTEGRPDIERGNDKVVIVLTDGANTYYTPSSLSATDSANNKSTYSSYGYTGKGYNGTSTTRLFMNTSTAVSKTDYSNANYTTALNEQFAALCTNAKAGNLIVMTVALDLSSTDTTEKKQIDMLSACASNSRFTTAKKLFWNATGATLSTVFKEIADELSNLRIVG